MSRQHKYLVTTNAETGEIETVEQIGSLGELIRVDPTTLLGASVAAPRLIEQEGDAEPREVEAAAPGVFFGGSEMPDVRAAEAATPGVYFHGPELPDVAPQ